MIDVRDDGDITQGHSDKPYGSGAQKRRMLRAPLATISLRRNKSSAWRTRCPVVLTPFAISGRVDMEAGAAIDAQAHIEELALFGVQFAEFLDQMCAGYGFHRAHIDGVEAQVGALAGTFDAAVDGGATKDGLSLQRTDYGDYLIADRFERWHDIRPERIGRNGKRLHPTFTPLGVAAEELLEGEDVGYALLGEIGL
jgi:hypothetical protein